MQDINLVPYGTPRLPATPQSPTVRDVVAVGFRHGWLMVTVTSSGPVADTSLMSLSAAPISVLLRYSVKFWTSAALSSGVPSWNLIPSRSVIFHCV